MTRLYTVSKVSNFIDNPRIKSFHSTMFHGLAERGGQQYPHDKPVFAYTPAPEELLISRTGRCVPEIFQPSSELVVCQRLAQRLAAVPNVRTAPVKFKLLVDVEFKKGDTTWWEKWGSGDPLDLLKALPDIPEFHRTIGNYFEVQTWRLQDIEDRYPEAMEYEIAEGTPPMDEMTTVRLSDRMLKDFPILWYGDTLMSAAAFQLVADELDRDFFLVREYHLSSLPPRM